MPVFAIALLAAGTYAFRVTGPLAGDRLRVPARVQRLLSVAAAVLLIALAVTSAVADGHSFAGWSRPAGVLVGGVLAARRAPLPVVVLAAAAVTAVLRLCGVS
jgi:branched-subunit amino acid transport protein